MKKTLIILAHPNIAESKVNKALIESIKDEPNITIHDLYATYKTVEAIDVAKEQALLVQFDRIIFQFPLYWYSAPAMLKEWQDKVLGYGFAYGPEGSKLAGKESKIVVSTGSPEYAYQAGAYNNFTLSEYLRPLQSTIVFTGMDFKGIFAAYSAMKLTEEALLKDISHYQKILKSEDWSTSLFKFLAE
ncbi:NAD(P)H-dependent oxidoreductase [Sulfurospirillum oryzae]|uniref:NAD(P)H-dependent oxidoreductase n=1 Tax=Sulfurospirillum oryzae TaxID=2976535 RepID=UPI0021E963CC|nr:NAD(P)H-dependent oxidoreductase [Sulfurospirillum oryzae]